MHQDPLAVAAGRAPDSPRSAWPAREPPPTTRLPPQHFAGRIPRRGRAQRAPGSAACAPWIAARIGAPPRSRCGAATCTGVPTDRKLSAISSSAASAASRSAGGPPAMHPAELHLRQPDRLRQAAERERQHRRAARRCRSPGRPPRAGSRQTPRRRSAPSRARGRRPTAARAPRARDERAGRVVRRHDQQRARVRRARAGSTRSRSSSGRGTRARTGAPRYPSSARQMLEQRIAGLRHQHGVARIAQQLEQPRVGLAGAGGQDDLRRDRRWTPRRR